MTQDETLKEQDSADSKRGESKSFEETTVSEFLGLTPADEAVIEIRRRLARELRERRNSAKLTQETLAERRGTTQSRVSDMENADSSVSIDALIASLVEMGATTEEIGQLISK
jgi:predicted XRE-type DNA-binding protein